MTAVPVNTLSVCEMCDLEAENGRLKAQLEMLRQRAADTEALFQRLQEWEMRLLGITSLQPLLKSMTGDLRARFHVDQARLLLPDRDRRIRGLLDCFQAEAPQDVLFESLPSPLKRLREPRLMVLPEGQGLPPLFEPGGPIRSIALMPLVRDRHFFGILGVGSCDGRRYGPDLQTHALSRLAAICSVCLENAVNRARLEIGGLTDPLTGLHNRRSLEQRLHGEVAKLRRHHEPLSCLFLDLDLFKQINDRFGHSGGDAVLQEVADRLRSTLRSGEVAARFGGDELAVLLPGTSPEDARKMAERIRSVVSSAPLDLGNGVSIPIGLSIGVGTLQYPDLPDDNLCAGKALMQAADAALYEAKRAGRNRVA